MPSCFTTNNKSRQGIFRIKALTRSPFDFAPNNALPAIILPNTAAHTHVGCILFAPNNVLPRSVLPNLATHALTFLNDQQTPDKKSSESSRAYGHGLLSTPNNVFSARILPNLAERVRIVYFSCRTTNSRTLILTHARCLLFAPNNVLLMGIVPNLAAHVSLYASNNKLSTRNIPNLAAYVLTVYFLR